ncbi:MAG: glycosyltransferase [Rhodospirillum sp.]|nr:glycosyltransferase [Rhodospirillum sp.]MCF8487625.1 glycosyltransferase [Rhodospirillum sp.]MCF8499229.1 glycosyltransferase [Rhodospirillum sp.]
MTVSIIMRTKNRPLMLARAMMGIRAQTHGDWELIVVNDVGDPAPVERLYRHIFPVAERGKIHVVHRLESLGMEDASNAGLEVAQGDHIVVHDDDDSWEPTYLEVMLGALASKPHPKVGAVACWTRKVIEEVTDEGVTVKNMEFYGDPFREVPLWRMAGSNFIPNLALLYERRVLEAVGGYRADLPVLGDWEFNIRMLRHFEIMVVPSVLANYHHRPDTTDPALANTVTAGLDKHLFFHAMIINDLLRRDLEEGRLGMGVIASMAAHRS